MVLGTVATAIPAAKEQRAVQTSRNIAHVANRPWAAVNSDLAFWGNLLFAGNYRGFRIYEISDPANPGLLSSTHCRGPQGDLTVHEAGERLILAQSIDSNLSTSECPPKGGAKPSSRGFGGIRLFDVTDPRAPFFVTAVPTDCGSHTHTWVPDPDNQRSLIYVSSFPARRDPNCTRHHGKISIVEIPYGAPEQARVLSEPPLHEGTKGFFGHGVGCHDIAVFMELEIAAAACMGEGQLWDISDPANPDTTGPGHTHIRNPNFRHGIWHSASFTWDGKVVLFGDETFDSCRGARDRTGNIWFYATVTPGTPIGAPGGRYTIPRRQPPGASCTAHNYNVIPVEGRYLGVAGFYYGGTSVFDFTDPSRAQEIAYLGARGRRHSDVWSAYWYNDHIYASDSLRGIDVLQLLDEQGQPLRARTLPYMNPQTQETSAFASPAPPSPSLVFDPTPRSRNTALNAQSSDL